MSGSGRKSNYRKSITSAFLDDVVPNEGEEIFRIASNRGSHIFEIESSMGIKSLAVLPSKFRKLIWIKTNDFVLVDGNEEDKGAEKAKYEIKHIFSRDNMKYLKSQQLWPFENVENEKKGYADDIMPMGDIHDDDNEYEEEPVGIVSELSPMESKGLSVAFASEDSDAAEEDC
jgi:translation initiation factor IF-1